MLRGTSQWNVCQSSSLQAACATGGGAGKGRAAGLERAAAKRPARTANHTGGSRRGGRARERA